MSKLTEAARLNQLAKLFDEICSGETPLERSNFVLFLEAIYTNTDPPTCVGRLLDNTKIGLDSLQKALCRDTSPEFLNGHGTRLCSFLRSLTVSDTHGRDSTGQILSRILSPPTFLNAFVGALRRHLLTPAAEGNLGWLLLQIASSLSDTCPSYDELLQTAKDKEVIEKLVQSSSNETQASAYKLKSALAALDAGRSAATTPQPGGRHDNDHADFRLIAVRPTADELRSTEPPFLRNTSYLTDPAEADSRTATHIDNQFRLLREDMLAEIRKELAVALGAKEGRRRAFASRVRFDGIFIPDTACGKIGVMLVCEDGLGLSKLAGDDEDERETYFRQNTSIIGDQSLACLIVDDRVVAIVLIHRDERLLAKTPPVAVTLLDTVGALARAIVALKSGERAKLVSLDNTLFSSEPVLLALQELNASDLRLEQDILHWAPSSGLSSPHSLSTTQGLVDKLLANRMLDFGDEFSLGQVLVLDDSQVASFVSGLTQTVSLIQGPPCTGKLFLGSLLARALFDLTTDTILVVCHTNYALDRFVERLKDLGISADNVARLRKLPTGKTKQQTSSDTAKVINEDDTQAPASTVQKLRRSLRDALPGDYAGWSVSNTALLSYLQFVEPTYFEALQTPSGVHIGDDDVDSEYVFQRWSDGEDAGLLKAHPHALSFPGVWAMPVSERRLQIAHWTQAVLLHEAEYFSKLIHRHNKEQDAKSVLACVPQDILTKRIIACTAAVAAEYRADIHAARPTILLVEEAGQIQESHILAAMGSSVRQLILIGDHEQLRPKCNSPELSVGAGKGFDLDRSLFERLLLHKYPHQILTVQHDMRHEISDLVGRIAPRKLAQSPDIPSRPSMQSLQRNILFIDHAQDEDAPDANLCLAIGDRDRSCTNEHEAGLVLNIVEYLDQHGYPAPKLVVLTACLGQLRLLHDKLSPTHEPIFNELDTLDLRRAGLLPATPLVSSKPPIRLATIDNHQGEKSDVAIISFARGVSKYDIGFMSTSRRLSALITRALDGIIMIGNRAALTQLGQDGDVWRRFFQSLETNLHIFNGLPVKCELHPTSTRILRTSEEFRDEANGDWCAEICNVSLNCSEHTCRSKCHRLSDHSGVACDVRVPSICDNDHKNWNLCHLSKTIACARCSTEKTRAEHAARLEVDRQIERDAAQAAQDSIDAELAAEIALQRHRAEAKESELELVRKQKLLDDMRAKRDQPTVTVSSTPEEVSDASSGTSQPLVTSEDDVQMPVDPVATVSPPSASSSLPSPPTPPPPPPPPIYDADLPFPSASNPEQVIPATVMAPPPSPAEAEWLRQKEAGAENEYIDELMSMIGLEKVKLQFLEIKAEVETSKRQGVSMKKKNLNAIFLGNPGTGKTTVGRLYCQFLAEIGVVSGTGFVETTGAQLVDGGTSLLKDHLETLEDEDGGALFIDEAYQLSTKQSVLDFLLTKILANLGKIVFLFAGYNDKMEKFLQADPGLPSRVPNSFQFDDYTDPQLVSIFDRFVTEQYGENRMSFKGGKSGVYVRIAVRRVGRRRGQSGFGNARAIGTLLNQITQRQAKRLTLGRQHRLTPDDFMMTVTDLLGPNPLLGAVQSAAWKELQEMIGLSEVKESLRSQIDLIQTNYKRELEEKEPMGASLNRVFLGNPGTGKTTVAKLYGRILADLGLLSNGEVIVKNPSDFIGQAVGNSEANTKAILAASRGKVLVIDEAYSLYEGSSNGAGSYKTAVIDTIVAEVQSTVNEDRCVLLLGYKEQMEEMFQHVNPGLSRRFAIENAFNFADFSPDELKQILHLKMRSQHLAATPAAERVALEVLQRQRVRPHFGNGGAVEILLGTAKKNFQARQSLLPTASRSHAAPFEPEDFDPDYARSNNAANNLADLFKDMIGAEDIMSKLRTYQETADRMKARGIDYRTQTPTTFVFKGPPGTGKTTVARMLGKVYYDMGFLASDELFDCSASDLVAQYVGQTGPKVRNMFDRALGKCLFIDEAYRLSEGHFAKEAMDEIVDCLTKDKYRGHVVVILAGYEEDINNLLSVNRGLASRFTEELRFSNLKPTHCFDLLTKLLKKHDVLLESSMKDGAVELFRRLASVPGWGNARDVGTLAQKMMSEALKNIDMLAPNASISLAAPAALGIMCDMLNSTSARASNKTGSSEVDPPSHDHLQFAPDDPPYQTFANFASQVDTLAQGTPSEPDTDSGSPPNDSDGREPGVSDATWRELQLAQQAAIQAALEIESLNQLVEDPGLEDEKRRDAAARLEEERKKLQREEEIQQKLREMGVCPYGYRWIRQSRGYRCAGGTHFVTNDRLGI